MFNLDKQTKRDLKEFFIESLYFLWDLAKIVIISLAVILPVRYYLMQPFFVSGTSMVPNFQNKDYLIIDELTYHLREPERGEVIVFKYPKDPSQYFIKRIIGLPGEHVEVMNGQIVINDETYLDESGYLPEKAGNARKTSMTLGPNEYFVMGDNRGVSLDSRSWGALDRDLIIGKVWLRALPLSTFEFYSAPEY